MVENMVVAGNIGIVYTGTNGFLASVEYNRYVGLAKRNIGRAAGESVTWLRDDVIFKEYIGEE